MSKKTLLNNSYTWLAIVASASVLMLSGCAGVTTAIQSATEQEKSKILYTSYQAADIIAQQANSHVSPSDVIGVEPLLPLDAKYNNAAFGHVVSQNVSARLVQLGYNVGIPTDIPQTPYPMPSQPSPITDAYGNVVAVQPVQPYQQPTVQRTMVPSGIVLTGHYAETRTGMLVSLRLVHKDMNRILAAYDYSIPMQSQVRDLLKTGHENEDKTILGVFE